MGSRVPATSRFLHLRKFRLTSFSVWGEALSKDNLSEQDLRELYEIERTLSFVLQSAINIPGLIQASDTLKAMVHDVEGARNQLREFMRASGWKGNF